MLSIYAPTKYHDSIQAILQKEERLSELINVIDYLEARPILSAHSIVIKQDMIWPVLDWFNLQPPFILPEEIPFNPENLLGLLFAKLNNFEKVHEYLSKNNPSLNHEIDLVNRLQQGVAINPGELSSEYNPFDEYRLMHNQAIVHHYASTESFDLDKTVYFYGEAIKDAPHDTHKAFTIRHLSSLLIDTGNAQRAVKLLDACLALDLEEEAKIALKQVKCDAWMQLLRIPYDTKLLQQLKTTLWEVLKAFESQKRWREAAMVYTDAGIVANYSESWAESLGYFNKALSIFEEEQLPEMAANVHYRKGILLSTWAQNGNPQFFRGAAESHQKALKVFTKHTAPVVYADIQHHLGMIYAEIPDEVKKKSIWAAVSSSAFKEALEIYTKDQFPYEYASVCNHYGNALTKYPEAKLSDNNEKALYYYQEALNIRSAQEHPFERSLTLLNYLEAQWHRAMPEDKFDEERYQDMLNKTTEILSLTQDEALRSAAQQHLERLDQLKMAYA